MGVFALREVCYATEGSFAENATAPGSNTWSTRFPVLSIDSGPPAHDRQSDSSIQNRQNETRPGFLGARSATFDFTCYWGGHNGTTGGALTETWLQDLLSDGLGGGNVAQVGAAVSSGTSATQFASAGTAVSGAVVRVGAKADGRADGQAGVVNNATTITLHTALPGTPNGSDTMYATQMAFSQETVSTSKRFLCAFTDTGAQYHYMGCQLARLKFNLPIGGLPTVGLGYDVAYWDRTAVTTPSALALEDNRAAPIAGGSVFIQTVGTTTRAIESPAEITLELDIGITAQHGPAAGQANYQSINALTRTRCVPKVSLLVPWSTTYDSLYNTDGAATTHKHILVCCNATDGRSVGFYLPRAYVVGPRPTYEDYNGLTYQRLTFQGREGTDTATELTRSAVRFFMG